MGIISDIAHTIDTTLIDYVQTVYDSVAEPIRILLGAVALVALLFIAVNHVIQFRPVNYSMYLQWGLRYILIYAFATMWVNFQGIYTLLMEVPNDYATLMLRSVALTIQTVDTRVLDPARITDVYSAMDEFAHAIIWIAHEFLRDISIFHIGKSLRNIFTGALILIIGGIFTAASAIIILIGKIGFALAISLAPLAIIMLMTPQTKQHFESWTRFTIGFVVIPLLTSGLMTIVLFVASQVLATSGASTGDKTLYFGFLFIMIAALVLLYMLPTMASTLASASVAAVGAGATFAAASMARGAARSAMSGGQRLRDGASAAKQARSAGASPVKAASSAINAMRQSAHIRQQRRDDRLAKRIVGQKQMKSDGRGAASGGDSSSDSSSSATNSPLSAEQTNLYR